MWDKMGTHGGGGGEDRERPPRTELEEEAWAGDRERDGPVAKASDV